MCIDVEPDGFFIDRNKPLPWKGYENAYRYFKELRLKLEISTGSPVHFTWCYRLDPQVAQTYGSADWPITNYPKFIEDFLSEGDELALHPHAYRWEASINNWIEDLGNQDWVNHCVEMGFDCYQKLFHRTCDSFRFGSYWMSTETINLAERLGAKFDLTVEPGFRLEKRSIHPELYSAPLPDYDHVPLVPYRPSRTDFTKPDAGRHDGIWIIPMSTRFVTYQYGRVEILYKRMFSSKELKPRPITLNWARGSNGFRIVMEDCLASERPYLLMVSRSDVWSGKCLDPKQPDHMEKNVDYILNHPSARDFVFSTSQEAMSLMGYVDQEKAVLQS